MFTKCHSLKTFALFFEGGGTFCLIGRDEISACCHNQTQLYKRVRGNAYEKQAFAVLYRNSFLFFDISELMATS